MRTQIEIAAIAVGLIAVLGAALTAGPIHAAPGIAGDMSYKSYKALPATPGHSARSSGLKGSQARNTKGTYGPDGTWKVIP